MNQTAIKGLLGVFTVLLVGTMALFASALIEQDQPSAAPVLVEQSTAEVQSTLLSEAQAIAAAKQIVSGSVAEVEFDGSAYEIEFDDADETEVLIDANTGAVLGTEKTVDASSVGPTPINEQEAIAIARRLASGSFEEAELESVNGVMVYAVEFIEGDLETEVLVDVNTGSVIDIEYEREDDD